MKKENQPRKLTIVGRGALRHYDGNYFLSEPRNKLFVADIATANELARPEWIWLKPASGETMAITPLGLMCIIGEKPPLFETEEDLPYHVPDPDWLYAKMVAKAFFPNAGGEANVWHCIESLFSVTTEGLRQTDEENKAARLLTKTRMESLGMEYNPENIELFTQAWYFDFFYDYSDDHRYCMSQRAREKTLRGELAKWPALLAAFNDAFKETKA